jgi:hypothetical protein
MDQPLSICLQIIVRLPIKALSRKPEFWLALLRLKKRQAGREERTLVIPNERRATMSGVFSGATP